MLRFYKKELKQLTECLRQEGVDSGQPQVKDDAMDSKLNALSSLAGEDPMTMGNLLASSLLPEATQLSVEQLPSPWLLWCRLQVIVMKVSICDGHECTSMSLAKIVQA